MRRALRIRGFRPLAVTYTLNELGDWLATIALAVLVYDHTGDALATTVLFLSTKFLPSLFVPALAARVERIPVARALAGFYVVESLAFAALALTASAFSLILICVLAFVDGTLATTARAVTRAASVALLEPAGVLRDGNAALNVGFATMNVAGPAVAGVLVATGGSALALALAAALFLALAVLMASTHGLPTGTTDESPWNERLRDGAAYVWSHPVARSLILTQAGLLVLFTLVVPIEVVYADKALHAGDGGFAALVTAWGIGLVAGSLVFTRVAHHPIVRVVGVSTLAIGAGYLGMSAAPGLAVACAAAVVGGAGNGVQWVAVITALQESVEATMQARVAGFFEACATAMPGIGFILGGALTAAVSPRAAFAVSGAGVVLVVAVGAVAYRMRRRRLVVRGA
ncbi:MAG: MFS transporter [Solirubrobacteraceae bacterium]